MNAENHDNNVFQQRVQFLWSLILTWKDVIPRRNDWLWLIDWLIDWRFFALSQYFSHLRVISDIKNVTSFEIRAFLS